VLITAVYPVCLVARKSSREFNFSILRWRTVRASDEATSLLTSPDRPPRQAPDV